MLLLCSVVRLKRFDCNICNICTRITTLAIGSISAVSQVRSLILPEERLSGDEYELIFPNSGW